MLVGLVGTGDPLGAIDDAGIEEVADARFFVGAERARTDIAFLQCGVLLEVVFVERRDFGRSDLSFEALHVDLAVAFEAHSQRLSCAVGVPQRDDDVLQCVRSGPVTVRVAQRRIAVLADTIHVVDELGNRRRLRRVVHHRRRQPIERDCIGHWRMDGLDVCCEVAAGAADERVFTNRQGSKELFRCRTAHGARGRGDDDEWELHPLEQLDVCVAMGLISDVEAGLVEVEAVRVLHREFASP